MSFHAGQSFTFGETPSATKWNYLWENDYALQDWSAFTNGTLPAALLTANSIAVGKMAAAMGAGATGDGTWDSWTPTLSGITIGNGTVNAKYIQVGKLVIFRILVTFGSTSAMGDGSFSAPVVASSEYDDGNAVIGQAQFATPATSPGSIRIETVGGPTVIRPIVWNASGTYASESGISSTVPFTWGTGDMLFAQGMYQAA